MERLCDFPLSGRAGRARGTRELVVAPTPFVVVYTVAEDVVVLRVLHGARRWPPAESGDGWRPVVTVHPVAGATPPR